jgi:predicted RNA binding protein YcfA (HicA-like mRNA interferase family)
MPAIGPIRQRDLVRYLRQLGWSGPYGGGKHLVMEKGDQAIPIPNPHQGDIGVNLLLRVLQRAGIDRATWEALR